MTWVFVPYEDGQKYTSKDLEPAAVCADEDVMREVTELLREHGFECVSGRWAAQGLWRCVKRGIVHYFAKGAEASICGRVKRANMTDLAVGLQCTHCHRARRTHTRPAI